MDMVKEILNLLTLPVLLAVGIFVGSVRTDIRTLKEELAQFRRECLLWRCGKGIDSK